MLGENGGNAVEALVKGHRVKQKNAKKAKMVTTQMDAAKPEVMKLLTDSKQTYMPVGQNEFVVLKTNVKRPPPNNEFIGLCVLYFFRQRGMQLTEADIQEFVTFMEEMIRKNSTTSQSVVVTNKKPIGAFFQ